MTGRLVLCWAGQYGLSVEQRKRLTIAVELVANPSIVFMDEPTSGLDARAAAIVMRTVRNTVDTGRTVVCTIHQPSIDIFEVCREQMHCVLDPSRPYVSTEWQAAHAQDMHAVYNSRCQDPRLVHPGHHGSADVCPPVVMCMDRPLSQSVTIAGLR